jgi:hypothetical protein
MADLTDEQRAMLDLERQHWRTAGAKDAEVHARFAMSLADYQRALNALLDDPAAVAYAPRTVRRLRRQRQRRIAERREGRASA